MKTLIIVALAIVCALGAWAAVPSYINEGRVPNLCLDQVRAEKRFAAMAMQFGLPYNTIQKTDGYTANLPAGSACKFRWGIDETQAYEWATVTLEESAAMPGVLFPLKGNHEGYYLHCQLGVYVDRATGLHNVIVAYGKFPPRDGRDGINGTNGINGSNGRDGSNGTNGRDGQVTTTQASPPAINITYNNFSTSRRQFASPQLDGMRAAVIVATQMGSLQEANNISAVALSNAEAHQQQQQQQQQQQDVNIK